MRGARTALLFVPEAAEATRDRIQDDPGEQSSHRDDGGVQECPTRTLPGRCQNLGNLRPSIFSLSARCRRAVLPSLGACTQNRSGGRRSLPRADRGSTVSASDTSCRMMQEGSPAVLMTAEGKSTLGGRFQSAPGAVKTSKPPVKAFLLVRLFLFVRPVLVMLWKTIGGSTRCLLNIR